MAASFVKPPRQNLAVIDELGELENVFAAEHREKLVDSQQSVAFDRDQGRRPYRDELFASRYMETGACGLGHLWYAFPGRRPGGYFESPGPCRYPVYGKRYRYRLRHIR